MKADIRRWRLRSAFRAVFSRDAQLGHWLAWGVRLIRPKRAAFRTLFGNEDGEIVLAHLARYCHATRTTFVDGSHDASAYYAGRRDVFLEIQAYLNISDEKLRETMRREDAINAA